MPQYLRLAACLHSPPLSASPQFRENDKRQTMGVQRRLSTYSSARCVPFLFRVSIYVRIITGSQHRSGDMTLPPLFFSSLPLFLSALSPTLPVQSQRKPLQRHWTKMIYGKWISERGLFLPLFWCPGLLVVNPAC